MNSLPDWYGMAWALLYPDVRPAGPDSTGRKKKNIKRAHASEKSQEGHVLHCGLAQGDHLPHPLGSRLWQVPDQDGNVGSAQWMTGGL